MRAQLSDSIHRRFADRVVVGDGSMGSELVSRLPIGIALDASPVDHPETVLEIHLGYLSAGAELIETATFGASAPRLEREGLDGAVEAINSSAVKLAREAREISGVDCLIAGAIGPLAGTIDIDEPDGPGIIATAHAEQAEILAGRGADLLFLETFFRFDELALAAKAVREVCDLPMVGLLTFATERPPHKYEEQARVVDELADLDFLAIGVNCAPGPMGALEILRNTRQTRVPLAALPNAGVLSRRDGRFFMPPATPEYLARFAKLSVQYGVSLVGGCCGTGAEHIRAIAESVRGLKPERQARTSVTVIEPEVAARPRSPESSLATKLEAGEFVRVVQLDPPKGTNADAVLLAADKLAHHPAVDAVDINSNPLARLRMDSLSLASEIQRRTGIETVPHITPRDASLMGLQSQLLGAWLGGVRNIFAVTGDPSQLGDYPGVHDVYHVDIFELVRAISRMAEGFDCAGNRIGDAPNFYTGVAVSPSVDDIQHEADRLKRKIDNGAHYAMTQVFFEWAPWERFLELFGGTLPIPVMIAVWPVRSLKMALRLHHEVPGIEVPDDLIRDMEAAGPDAALVGRERAVTLFREAPTYANGVYLIAPFKKPENVIPLIDEAVD